MTGPVYLARCMFEKEKLIPLVALLVFVVAVAGIFYGNQWDWVNALRGTPLGLVLMVGVLILVGVFGLRGGMHGRMRGGGAPWRPTSGNIGTWLMWGLVAFIIIVALVQFLGGR